jgi:hypothetical protein
VTVGAQQDLGLRPVGAHCAQQAAQEGANLLAAGSFGGTKNSGNEAALAIECQSASNFGSDANPMIRHCG